MVKLMFEYMKSVSGMVMKAISVCIIACLGLFSVAFAIPKRGTGVMIVSSFRAPVQNPQGSDIHPQTFSLIVLANKGAAGFCWLPDTSATTFYIQRKDAGGSTWTTIGSNSAGNTAFISHSPGGSTFRVLAAGSFPYYTTTYDPIMDEWVYTYVGTFSWKASEEKVLPSTGGAIASFSVTGLSEDLNHKIGADLTVLGGEYQRVEGSFPTGGGAALDTNFYMCVDDNRTTSGEGLSLDPPTSGSTINFAGMVPSSGLTGTATGYLITTSPQIVKIKSVLTSGVGKVVLVQVSTIYRRDATGPYQGAWSATASRTRDDYNLIRVYPTAASIDTRRSYGPGNLAGAITADANADLRNQSFSPWIYKGGLFVGRSLASTGDQSGMARIQVSYTLPTTVHPEWSALALMYTGIPNSYSPNISLSLFKPSSTDPNLTVAPGTATWTTRWDLAAATKLSDFNITSTTPLWNYACFQSATLEPRYIVALANEANIEALGGGYWGYFASAAYVSSGINPASNAWPRVLIIDRVNEVIPQ